MYHLRHILATTQLRHVCCDYMRASEVLYEYRQPYYTRAMNVKSPSILFTFKINLKADTILKIVGEEKGG